MKQGRASINGPADQKIEPIPKIKSPGAVSIMGNKVGTHTMDGGDIDNPNFPNMDLGNGFSPNGPVRGWDGSGPGAGRTIRKTGSQGKW